MADATPTRQSDASESPTLALVVLALAFAGAVTTELLPVGLLPEIGRVFAVSASTAGLLVTLFAAMVALFSVPLTLATRRIPGKHILLLTMGGYAVSNLVCAIAPNFAVLAIGRAIGGLSHAIFSSVCIGFSSRLVPPERTGRALAIVSSGVSVGLILGAPLATALGNAVGWRFAFGALSLAMLMIVGLMAMALPSLDTRVAHARVAGTGRRRIVVPVLAANLLAYLGQYGLYTYVAVLLLRSGATSTWVAPILFGFGFCGLVGIGWAARYLDRRPVASALVILTVCGIGMVAVGLGYPSLVAVLIAGAVWNAAFGPGPSLFQSAAVRVRAFSPEITGAWVNVTANIGLGGGAALGGIFLDRFGVARLAWAAAVPIFVAAALIAVGLARLGRLSLSRDRQALAD